MATRQISVLLKAITAPYTAAMAKSPRCLSTRRRRTQTRPSRSVTSWFAMWEGLVSLSTTSPKAEARERSGKPSEKFTEGGRKGETRDFVGEALGISGVTYSTQTVSVAAKIDR
jgi:hypothetical protein